MHGSKSTLTNYFSLLLTMSEFLHSNTMCPKPFYLPVTLGTLRVLLTVKLQKHALLYSRCHIDVLLLSFNNGYFNTDENNIIQTPNVSFTFEIVLAPK